MWGLRKLFQVDCYERKRFVHECFEGAFFHVVVVSGKPVNCPGGDSGRDFGGDFSPKKTLVNVVCNTINY